MKQLVLPYDETAPPYIPDYDEWYTTKGKKAVLDDKYAFGLYVWYSAQRRFSKKHFSDVKEDTVKHPDVCRYCKCKECNKKFGSISCRNHLIKTFLIHG